jgi:hypothetical protein
MPTLDPNFVALLKTEGEREATNLLRQMTLVSPEQAAELRTLVYG